VAEAAVSIKYGTPPLTQGEGGPWMMESVTISGRGHGCVEGAVFWFEK